jgi:Ser/Thr protein kinase RdoA (MazF antagonist)
MLLDFDDFVTGPAVQDVWMLVPSADAEGDRQRRVLIEAYDTLRAFDPSWLRLVEPLRALRFIHYATWIARRCTPATRSSRGRSRTSGRCNTGSARCRICGEQIARLDAAD